jgi:hypothetical protein
MRQNMEKIFPTVIILLSLGAAIVYALKGDVRHATYWFAATVLNISVTY